MKYLWYGFWGLFSLGFLGLLVAVAGVAYILNFYGQSLPDYSQLKNYQPPIVTRLYAGDGRLLAEFAQEKRVFIPIEAIPARVKNAFIAAEDKNFYTHEGVDFTAIGRALVVNLKNMGHDRRPVGASTITQQVAKNFLLTNEVSYERKIKEAILANRMERAMTKDRLLELYLNQIFLGSRAYGVGAAALEYFNKSLEELSVAEAAYLAALPKAPNNYNPVKHHEAALARRNWVITRMQEDGYITAVEAQNAIKSPLETIPPNEEQLVHAPYFAEEVRRTLGEKYGEDSLYKGGLAVRTTIDPALQEAAVKALRAGLMEYDQRHGYRGPVQHFPSTQNWQDDLASVPKPPAMLEDWALGMVLEVSAAQAKIGFKDGREGIMPLAEVKWARKYLNEGYQQGPEITATTDVLAVGDVVMTAPVTGKTEEFSLRQIPDIQGALIAMDPHTGRILAMQGGWTYGISEFNRATQAQRQPGSAFKPFVYLTALENGFTPATLIEDAPFVIEDRPGHFWSPTNYHGDYFGPTPLRVGIEKSRNLMTVRLAHFLGMDKIVAMAAKFGIDPAMPPHLSNALGAGETTLLNLTSAYAVLVNGGKKVTPSFIDRIQDRAGITIFRHDDRACPNCGPKIRWEGQMVPEIPDTRAQLTDPKTAYQMVSILEGVVQRGTAVKLKELGRPLAGKTGTTNESKDTWFIGFSPDLVAGVFMGFDAPRSVGKRETGASVSVPVFEDFMKEALKDAPILPFRMPNGIRNVQVNAKTGARTKAGGPNVIWEAFVNGTEPTVGARTILDDTGLHPVGDSAAVQGQNSENPDVVSDGEIQTNDLPVAPTVSTPAGQSPTMPVVPPAIMPETTTDTGTGGLY